eukprot:11208503-Lingulodinium_polyedra.AAC.1
MAVVEVLEYARRYFEEVEITAGHLEIVRRFREGQPEAALAKFGLRQRFEVEARPRAARFRLHWMASRQDERDGGSPPDV